MNECQPLVASPCHCRILVAVARRRVEQDRRREEPAGKEEVPAGIAELRAGKEVKVGVGI